MLAVRIEGSHEASSLSILDSEPTARRPATPAQLKKAFRRWRISGPTLNSSTCLQWLKWRHALKLTMAR